MNKKFPEFDLERYKHRAEIVKALAHPARLYIVEALAIGELCVCELHEAVGTDMSTVSRHLSVLRSAGIIESDKRGLQVFYRLRTPCILQFMSCVDKTLEHDLVSRQACLNITGTK